MGLDGLVLHLLAHDGHLLLGRRRLLLLFLILPDRPRLLSPLLTAHARLGRRAITIAITVRAVAVAGRAAAMARRWQRRRRRRGEGGSQGGAARAAARLDRGEGFLLLLGRHEQHLAPLGG